MQHDLKHALQQQQVRVNDGSAAALVRAPLRKPALRAQTRAYASPHGETYNRNNPAAKIFTAILLGMLAVMLSRYFRFQINGSTLVGTNAFLTMIMDTGLALAVALTLKAAIRLNFAYSKATVLCGILLMISAMHNAVHLAPSAFGALFSTGWVNQVVAYTEPNSILLYGGSITLPSDPKPVLEMTGKITVSTLDG